MLVVFFVYIIAILIIFVVLGTLFCRIEPSPFNLTIDCPYSPGFFRLLISKYHHNKIMILQNIAVEFTCPGIASGTVEYNCSTSFRTPTCLLREAAAGKDAFILCRLSVLFKPLFRRGAISLYSAIV